MIKYIKFTSLSIKRINLILFFLMFSSIILFIYLKDINISIYFILLNIFILFLFLFFNYLYSKEFEQTKENIKDIIKSSDNKLLL
jgi:Ca2+/Na+ antiporter